MQGGSAQGPRGQTLQVLSPQVPSLGRQEVTVECGHLQGPPSQRRGLCTGDICSAQTELGVLQPSLRMTLRVVALISGAIIYTHNVSLSMYHQPQTKLCY